MKKILLSAAGACLALFFTAGPLMAGNHKGEQKQLDVSVSFSGSYGETVTDATGLYYRYWGMEIYEPKVYPQQYWGTFPLYFFGYPTTFSVTVSNLGPRAVAKLRVRAESYELRTDGSNGPQLIPPQEWEVEVRRGETKTLDVSYVSELVAGAEGGLDRLVVKVLHPNEGGGPGNADPALILQKEAVYCPPAHTPSLPNP